MSSLKALLLEAPDDQLDKSMLPLIEMWDDEPKAIQILQVLDRCIYSALASGFVVSTLQIMLEAAMKAEQLTLEQLVPLATWRQDGH